jgi:hypothetical protein
VGLLVTLVEYLILLLKESGVGAVEAAVIGLAMRIPIRRVKGISLYDCMFAFSISLILWILLSMRANGV